MVQDKLLWDSFLNGDASGFERLYHLYYSELAAYARRFRNDGQFVTEVIQDLFVKLWQNRSGLGRPDSVRFYLLRALRNTAISKLQGNSRELLMDSWEAFSLFETEETTEEDVLARYDGIDLDVLTDRQREAIHLFYFQNLSYEEMAALLNIQVGAAYKLIYRALDTLRSSRKKSRRGRLTDLS